MRDNRGTRAGKGEPKLITEQELVRRAKAGDENAFERLVTLYEKKVYNMALRYIGNEHDALDVCQETFLRVFRFLPRFNEQSQFSTWLYRIAINACKDSVLRTRRRAEQPLEWPDPEGSESFCVDVSDVRYNPERELERLELQEAIHAGLMMLSEDHRQILVMRDIAGMSYDEIGRCLSLEQGTVKSRIARARDRLRAFLSEEGNLSPVFESKSVKGGSSQ